MYKAPYRRGHKAVLPDIASIDIDEVLKNITRMSARMKLS